MRKISVKESNLSQQLKQLKDSSLSEKAFRLAAEHLAMKKAFESIAERRIQKASTKTNNKL